MADLNTATIEEKVTPTEPAVTIELKPAAAIPPPIPKTKKKVSVIGLLCGSTVALIIFGIGSAIPISEMIVGWSYADQCRINWRIPHYLYIAGVIGIIAIVLGIVQIILAMVIAKKTSNGSSNLLGIVAAFGVCGTSIVTLFLSIFLFGWFIAGSIWIFGAWNKVQYTDVNASNYCHPTLYRFAVVLIIISIVMTIIQCFRSCKQSNNPLKAKQKRGLTAVPTSEP